MGVGLDPEGRFVIHSHSCLRAKRPWVMWDRLPDFRTVRVLRGLYPPTESTYVDIVTGGRGRRIVLVAGHQVLHVYARSETPGASDDTAEGFGGRSAASWVEQLLEGAAGWPGHIPIDEQALEAIRALGAAAVPPLVAALFPPGGGRVPTDDPQDARSYLAVKALTALGPAALPAARVLAFFLTNELLSIEAADAIRAIGGAAAPFVIGQYTWLTHGERGVLDELILALGEPGLDEFARQCLGHPDAGVGYDAAALFGRVGGRAMP